MARVPVVLWGEEPEHPGQGGFEDMMFSPVAPPKPDPEQTPEEHRDELFHESDPGESYANDDTSHWNRAGRDATEVCIMSGWPPRHIQVGQHCPHGVLGDEDEEEIIDYT